MENEYMIRKCGSDFKYCNGDCVNCEINRYKYTNGTANDNKSVERRH